MITSHNIALSGSFTLPCQANLTEIFYPTESLSVHIKQLVIKFQYIKNASFYLFFQTITIICMIGNISVNSFEEITK